VVRVVEHPVQMLRIQEARLRIEGLAEKAVQPVRAVRPAQTPTRLRPRPEVPYRVEPEGVQEQRRLRVARVERMAEEQVLRVVDLTAAAEAVVVVALAVVVETDRSRHLEAQLVVVAVQAV